MAAASTATASILTALTLLLSPTTADYCPIDFQQCTNGLFNPTTCQCDCIPPYCPDTSGDCLNPTGFCGGNPWQSCSRGLDCPWWPNPLKAESCTTGNTVPAGIWHVHPNLEFCCQTEFPYSAVCTQTLTLTSPPVASPATTTTTTSTVTTTTTTTVQEMESIPLKFSLMGLPVNMNDIGGFKDVMMDELKSILTNAAEQIDMKVTNIQEVYDLTIAARKRTLSEASTFASSKPTQTIHLYYDVEVLKNPNQQNAPRLIQEIRANHANVLQDLQEYNGANGYEYMSNFDLCTTSSSSMNAKFDICTLDHEVVKVKFSTSNLNPSLNRDDLEAELLTIYRDILRRMEGLEMVDIALDRVAETSYGTDVYFNVDVITSDGNDWKTAIESELKKEASRKEILDSVQEYTIQTLGESGASTEKVNWCFDNQGVLTMNCNVAINSQYALPMWAIIAIASTAGAIVLCLAISCCICARQNAKDEDDMKYNYQSYIASPEQWRQSQIDGHPKKKRRVLPPPRHHRDDRYERDRRRRPKKERSFHRYTRSIRPPNRHSHRRSRSRDRPQRRRSPRRKYEHRETRETQPDEEMQMLALPPPMPILPPPMRALPPPMPALPPPQYEYVNPYYPPPPEKEELLALPPPQYDNLYNSDAALYCDDEEVNRPDPPMEAGPTAMKQQQQKQQVLMLTDGRASPDDSGNNQRYLAIEPAGRNWDSEYFSDDSK